MMMAMREAMRMDWMDQPMMTVVTMVTLVWVTRKLHQVGKLDEIDASIGAMHQHSIPSDVIEQKARRFLNFQPIVLDWTMHQMHGLSKRQRPGTTTMLGSEPLGLPAGLE